MNYLLLDDLAQHLSLSYISELKNEKYRRAFIDYMNSIEVGSYALDDWREACVYLTENTKEIKTIDEAKQMILKWLNS